jgi:hypothetical protein
MARTLVTPATALFDKWFAWREKYYSSHSIVRALLIAATMLIAQSAAAAHELKHALHQDNDPLCILHVYAAHLGNTPTTPPALPAAVVTSYPVELPLISFSVRIPRYFIPHSQAPPAVPFAS